MKVESLKVLVRVNLGNYQHSEAEVVLGFDKGTSMEDALEMMTETEREIRARLSGKVPASTRF